MPLVQAQQPNQQLLAQAFEQEEDLHLAAGEAHLGVDVGNAERAFLHARDSTRATRDQRTALQATTSRLPTLRRAIGRG